ncbi:MAG: methyltransferase domain-containing protein, partial [Ornithinimicrobium sp.]|uniref:methyltransferase domain-containing protein n=1 Tax=Ornithinimicrobium sp. TaxID=1977084 RepID=UPI0026E0E1A5
MQCDYFDAQVCRSCTLMGTGYAAQLRDKQARVAATLERRAPFARWLPPAPSVESGFRNKAKLVVGGRKGAPTLGILDPQGRGVDLRHCGLHEPGLAEAIPVLAQLIAASGLTPYDVPARQGELKHLIVTHSPDDELMIRLVLRSPGQLPRVQELLGELMRVLPTTRVVSVNLQPEHKAVLEGSEEAVLTTADTLPMRINDLTLHLPPRSFFQTNTAVAAALYRQSQVWIGEASPATVWDLYCGVGGFALHAAAAGRAVLGIESSPAALKGARRSAAEHDAQVTFQVGDASAYLVGRTPP